MNKVRLISGLLSAMLLSGCASQKPIYAEIEPEFVGVQAPEFSYPVFNDELVSQSVYIESAEEITRLSDDVKRDFYRYYNKKELANYSDVHRVSSYIGLLMDQFTYSQKTYTAQETIDNLGGNCLSLTILTTAIAKLAGVEVSYDLLNNNPTYALDEDMLVTSDHMRAVLNSGWMDANDTLFKVRGRITIDYFDTEGMMFAQNISPVYQLSLYYSNRAVELMLKKRYDEAFRFAEKATAIYPDNDSALISLAILHRRLGDSEVSESIYQYGLAKGLNQSPVFYRNYAGMLETDGRVDEIANLEEMYAQVKENHPLEWIRAGKRAHREGQYELAIKHFNRALKITPELTGLHLLSARANLALGRLDETDARLYQALSDAQTQGESAVYQRKLAKFRKFKKKSS